jgi:hypothetical protein
VEAILKKMAGLGKPFKYVGEFLREPTSHTIKKTHSTFIIM